MSYNLPWALALATLLSLAGCSAALYVPTDEDATPAASLDDLHQGRALYVHKCGSCHVLQLPERFTQSKWEQHLREMAPRARLNDQEKQLIWKFLLAGTERVGRK